MNEKPKRLPLIGHPRNARCTWCGSWRFYSGGYFVCRWCDDREDRECE